MAQYTPPFYNYLVIDSPLLPGARRAAGVPNWQRLGIILVFIAIVVPIFIAIKPAPAFVAGDASIEIESVVAEPAASLAASVETVEVAAVAVQGVQRVAKISHYWPPLGGVNCAQFVGGRCISRMASGLPWEEWIGRAAACPVELPFGTEVELPGGETFTCLDRGGKVVTTAAGELWIDLLVERAPVPYGTVMPVTVRLP